MQRGWITLNLLNRSRSSWSSGMPRTANTEIPSSGTPSSAQNSAVLAASWPRVPVVSGPPRMTSTSPPGGSSGRRRVAISLRSRIDPLAFECSRRAASQLADGCNDLFCGKILRNCNSRIVPIAVLFSAPERRYARNRDCSMYPSQPKSRGIGSERPLMPRTGLITRIQRDSSPSVVVRGRVQVCLPGRAHPSSRVGPPGQHTRRVCGGCGALPP